MKKVVLLCLVFSLFSFGKTFAQNGTALEFDGTDDYVNLGNEAGDGIRTVEMWFMLQECHDATATEVQTLICRDDLQNDHEFSLVLTNSVVSGGVQNAGKMVFGYTDYLHHGIYVASNSNSWEPFRWYHVAGVIHPVDGLTLFLDGVKQTETNNDWTSPVVATNSNTLLGSWLPNSTATRHFKGLLDDVHLSTAVEYTTNFTPPCTDRSTNSNTRALYLFNTGSGTTASDETNNYDGTLVNYPASTDDSWIHDYPCYDFSIFFNESSQASINIGNDLGGDIRTIEMFFTLRGTVTPTGTYKYTMIARNHNAEEHEFHLGFYDWNPGHLRFGMSDGNGNFSFLLSNTTTWNVATWYHVAIVIDPTNGTTMYIDGVADATNPNMTTAIVQNHDNKDIAIGNWGDAISSNRSFSGALDRVVISSDVLRTGNFNACNDQVVACNKNVLGYYRFNDKITNTFSDLSGRNNHGTPTTVNFYTFGGNTCNQARMARPSGSLEQELNIYPNPASSHLVIEHPATANVEINIYAINGQLVATHVESAEAAKQSIDVSKLENGIYFLTVNAADGSIHEVEKIVIHK